MFVEGPLRMVEKRIDFSVFDSDNNVWSRLRSIADVIPEPFDQYYTNIVRTEGVGFATSERGYIATGNWNSGLLTSVWEYNPFTDLWIQKTPLGLVNTPQLRNWALSWSTSDGRVFMGTGGNGLSSNSLFYGDMWEFLRERYIIRTRIYRK